MHSPVDDVPSATAQLERHRDHLHALARRLLGSAVDADDALQDAWLRVRDVDPGSVREWRPWLTTVVARVCLNHLRSTRARRERLTDFAVPDPAVGPPDTGPAGTPEGNAEIVDALGPALLVVLDALTPAQRTAFVLHDAFDVPFAEVADALGCSVAAAQQHASRGRRRARAAAPSHPDPALERAVVDAFFTAARDGDLPALLAVLAPDVELRVDGGRRRARASVVLRGADAVAGHTATYAGLFPTVRPALVDGGAGAVVAPEGRVFAVLAFDVVEGRIIGVRALADPDRLARLGLAVAP